MQRTQAIVFADVDAVHLQFIDMPDPDPDEVQIHTTYSTISAGTEGWMLHGLFTWGTTPFPYVPGYQRVGVIESLGSNVKDWRVGERVVSTASVWSGAVPPFSGSHAARSNVHVNEVYHLPDGVDERDASGVVVAQVGYNAASRLILEPNTRTSWVVVYGDGLIGQCAAQSARVRGAKVIVVGHRPQRLELARRYSADEVVNAHSEDVVSRVREITGHETVVGILDTVQNEAAQRAYLPLLEHGRGQIVYSGFTPRTTWADMALLQQQELTAHFVSGWSRERIETTLAWMGNGNLYMQPLITHLVPYIHAPEMYRLIQDKTTPFLGIVLNWEGAY